jgi:PA14 domain
MNEGWHLQCSGWPLWVTLPLAAVVVFGFRRVQREDLERLAPSRRRLLFALRAFAGAMLVLFFSEPSLTRRATETVLPRVALLVDQSGSMAVRDPSMIAGERAAEVVGLGLVKPGDRPKAADRAAQATADVAWVKDAKPGSPAANGLAALGAMSRAERAERAARDVLAPTLKGRARVDTLYFDSDTAPADPNGTATPSAGRGTDFEQALGSWMRSGADARGGAVIVVSDGRQTLGGDPLPAARALRARGAAVSSVFVGDPAAPPDAVVAEVTGPGEVFLGENAPLTVRYRITGADAFDWNLILSAEGRELARRRVRGDGAWNYATFVISATNSGVTLYNARLEMANAPRLGDVLTPSGGASAEIWTGVFGAHVADFFGTPAADKKSARADALSQLAYSGKGENYAARVRALVFPPQTGAYTFWISSDDGSELFVSPDENPGGRRRVAWVRDYVPAGSWDTAPSQQSEPVNLEAGRPCYIEILHKQGSGADHLSVGWRMPDGAMERPIPGSRLAPYDAKAVAEAKDRASRAAATRTNEFHEASLGNNAAEFPVAVSEDPIRALLVDATPRWESRYLTAMLERDKRVQLTRRYRSIIIDDPGLALLPRTQAEWNSYDMVVLGDLDAAEMPPDQQQRAAEFVARRGGFLAGVAGPRGLPGAFNLGALANLLPVKPTPGADAGPDPVRLALTPDGVNHPVTQVLDDNELNQKMWPLLPPFQWIAGNVATKPGATVLVSAQNRAHTPVVAIQRFGAGRVLWMGGEESWRWRDHLGERVHQTFWLQVMRWGLAGRLRGHDPRLQAGLDHYLMDPAETAELKVRAAPLEGPPVADAPEAKVENLDAPGTVSSTLAMTALPGAPGIWRAAISGLAEGRWRITVTHPDPRLRGLSEVRDLTVRARPGAEELDLSGDPAALERIAAAGGGRSVRLDEAAVMAREIAGKLEPHRETRQITLRLWNHVGTMLAVMGALCLEWALRKRFGLA